MVVRERVQAMRWIQEIAASRIFNVNRSRIDGTFDRNRIGRCLGNGASTIRDETELRRIRWLRGNGHIVIRPLVERRSKSKITVLHGRKVVAAVVLQHEARAFQAHELATYGMF